MRTGGTILREDFGINKKRIDLAATAYRTLELADDLISLV